MTDAFTTNINVECQDAIASKLSSYKGCKPLGENNKKCTTTI